MTEGAETLSERIHIVECINQTLSKSYGRLTDSMSLQEGNMHATKIISKDATLFLLDRHLTWESSLWALAQNTGHEIQALQKAGVKKLKRLRNLSNFMSKDKGTKTKFSLIST